MEVWQYRPQGRVIESLEWLTDVIRCKRAEYRLSLRQWPRQTFSCEYQMDEQTYGLAREKARLVGGNELFVPDWPRLSEIPSISAGTATLPVDTSHASSYHVGGSLLVFESASHYEVCTISAEGVGTVTISATTQAYTKPTIVPLRVGTFLQPFAANRPPAHYNTVSTLFGIVVTEDMVDATAVPYTTYLGHPLVNSPRETIKGLEDKAEQAVENFDSKLGPIANYKLQSNPTTAMSLSISTQTLQELINVRSFLATVRGRWKAFWLPSWNTDFTLTKDLSGGDDFIQVAAVDFVNAYGLGTDVAVITLSGIVIPLRVTSVTAFGGSERLHFDGAISGGLSMALVDRVCKLTFSRLDADRIEIQYMPGLATKIVVPTQEVPVYP